MRTALLALLLGGGCKNETPLTPIIDGSIAVTAGDFDDVQQPFNRMVVNTESYEGLITSATWDDQYDPANTALKVEDLLGEGSDISHHGLVVFASGTRGLGTRAYNGLETDDEFLGDAGARARVKRSVSVGAVVVMTDWAYDLAEQTWPDAVDYLGDDAEFDAAQAGEIGDVDASVTDDRLVDALGTDQIALRYDFSNWAVIESVDDDVTVWLRGDVTYRERDGAAAESLADVPLLVSYQPEGPAGGTVVVFSFHLDAQTPEVTDQILRTVVGNFEEQAHEAVDPL